MFRKKNRNASTLQSGRTAGLNSRAFRNSKKQQDLRSNLTQTRNVKGRDLNSKLKSRRLVDARQTIRTKPGKSKASVRSISSLEARRKEQRSNIHQQNRSFSLSDEGYIQITARQDEPPDRSATMSGDSIRITAKVDRNPADMDRKANLIAGYLTITAKNEEARRKEKEKEIRLKREKESEARRKEREHAIRKRESDLRRGEKDAKRKDRETEGLYSRMIREDVGSFDIPELYSDFNLRDTSVFEGRLDQSKLHFEKALAPSRLELPMSTGTRITVSNLHPLVTQQDVEELFGVVGQLRSCKMLCRGSAEVVYDKKDDAMFALSRYHNRKLDGQPMQCRLSTLPSAALYSPPPARLAPLPPLRPREGSSKTPLTKAPPVDRETRPVQQSSRPVVFKVRI